MKILYDPNDPRALADAKAAAMAYFAARDKKLAPEQEIEDDWEESRRPADDNWFHGSYHSLGGYRRTGENLRSVCGYGPNSLEDCYTSHLPAVSYGHGSGETKDDWVAESIGHEPTPGWDLEMYFDERGEFSFLELHDPELKDGELGMGNVKGKVYIRFKEPVPGMVFDPENARLIAENLARHAYEAHHGVPPSDAASALSEYIKGREVDKLRPQLITRAAHIIRSLLEKKSNPGLIAQHVVDSVLRAVT